MAWLFWKRIEIALKMAEIEENQSVLDFGCGGGVTFKYLSERDCSIVGCDSGFCEMAKQVCQWLDIKAKIYPVLSQIEESEFDCILALDVLEHVQEIDLCIEKLLELAHNKTRIIISGPTESVLYRSGRWFAGFSGGYHHRTIYDIEKKFDEKKLKRITLKKLYFPITLFRISSWRVR